VIRPSNHYPEVYLYRGWMDMRKSINGLAVIVEQEMELDPFAETLFVFCNRARDKVKILCWEKNGFILWYKRLEKQRFHWPARIEKEVVTLTGEQLNWLLDGFDIWSNEPHARLQFSVVA
jgi:transposase